MSVKFGLQLWNQVYTWQEARDAARRGEALGYDSLWTWEHALAGIGDPHQDTLDAYTLLAAWSQVTFRATLGVLVGANTFWNPGLLAKKVTTLDHVSDGRAILESVRDGLSRSTLPLVSTSDPVGVIAWPGSRSQSTRSVRCSTEIR